MTVKECIDMLENNGTRRVFDDKKKVFVDAYLVADREVIKVKYTDGYGYNQKDATIHI